MTALLADLQAEASNGEGLLSEVNSADNTPDADAE